MKKAPKRAFFITALCTACTTATSHCFAASDYYTGLVLLLRHLQRGYCVTYYYQWRNHLIAVLIREKSCGVAMVLIRRVLRFMPIFSLATFERLVYVCLS